MAFRFFCHVNRSPSGHVGHHPVFVDARVVLRANVCSKVSASRDTAFDLGADDYIMKPFSTDYLESVVMAKIQELMRKS